MVLVCVGFFLSRCFLLRRFLLSFFFPCTFSSSLTFTLHSVKRQAVNVRLVRTDGTGIYYVKTQTQPPGHLDLVPPIFDQHDERVVSVRPWFRGVVVWRRTYRWMVIGREDVGKATSLTAKLGVKLPTIMAEGTDEDTACVEKYVTNDHRGRSLA